MAVTTVYSAPDDGRKGRPKHVELLTPNKEHKKLHIVGIYMISDYHLFSPPQEIFDWPEPEECPGDRCKACGTG